LQEPVVIIIGQGEIGGPLTTILSTTYRCMAVDIEPVEVRQPCSVMHVCYPFQIADFVGTTAEYVRKYRPELVVINSTVVPGTTRKVAEASGVRVVYSPVRGKHRRMREDLMKYAKFVGGAEDAWVAAAEAHFASAGFKTARFPSAEAGELAKLVETTWLGVLVAFAQEAERFAAESGAAYEDLRAFISEVDFLPHHIFPGVIGGHCVMPNIALLKQQFTSEMLDAIEQCNERKKAAENSAVAVGR
jgi:UDP-N-acetyl-D-mannosaminuronate dehydrogenase